MKSKYYIVDYHFEFSLCYDEDLTKLLETVLSVSLQLFENRYVPSSRRYRYL